MEIKKKKKNWIKSSIEKWLKKNEKKNKEIGNVRKQTIEREKK